MWLTCLDIIPHAARNNCKAGDRDAYRQSSLRTMAADMRSMSDQT